MLDCFDRFFATRGLCLSYLYIFIELIPGVTVRAAGSGIITVISLYKPCSHILCICVFSFAF